MAYIGNSPSQGSITGGNIVDGSIESIDLATLTNNDINSGSIDGTVIGATAPAAGTFTTVTASGEITATGIDVTGIVTADGDIKAVETGTGQVGFNLARTGGTASDWYTYLPAGDADMTVYNLGARAKFGTGGDFTLYNSAGTTAKFFWDASAESLGIGTTTPTANLEIAGTSASTNPAFKVYTGGHTADITSFTASAGLQFMSYQSDAGSPFTKTAALIANGDGTAPAEMQFWTKASGSSTPSERMRIDSSGNLLVGQASTTNPAGASVVGHSLNASGFISSCRASDFSANFGRTTTDGAIVNFAKDGSTVGSIGTEGGDLTIGTANVGLKFNDSANLISPWDTTANAPEDGVFDLGYSSGRFKDLYLSGGIKAGSNSLLNFDDTSAGRVLIGCAAAGDTNGITTYIKGSASGTTTYLNFNRANTTASGTVLSFQNNSVAVGNISHTDSSTAYNTSSDYRLKENVVDMEDASSRVLALKPCRFNFISNPDTTVDGFIAHEAQEVVPEAVHGVKDEVDDEGNPVYQGIDQSKLVPLLTKALQEALTRIETLEAEVATLKGN